MLLLLDGKASQVLVARHSPSGADPQTLEVLHVAKIAGMTFPLLFLPLE